MWKWMNYSFSSKAGLGWTQTVYENKFSDIGLSEPVFSIILDARCYGLLYTKPTIIIIFIIDLISCLKCSMMYRLTHYSKVVVTSQIMRKKSGLHEKKFFKVSKF
jgi:predicted neutral ceramidase superfamily lipid hydrolase